LFYFDGETALAVCVLRATTNKKRSSTFLRQKVHPGDLARGFSNLEMTWLFYCTRAVTVSVMASMHIASVLFAIWYVLFDGSFFEKVFTNSQCLQQFLPN